MTLRNILLGTTIMRAPDAPGAAPVVEPVVVAAAEPAVAVEPAAVVEPVADVVVTEPAKPAEPNAHAEATLLEGADKTVEEPAKPAKVDEPAKPVEVAKVDELAEVVVEVPPITYEAFKLPEGVKFQEKELKEAQELFGSMKLTQDQAQSLMDRYTGEMQRFTEHLQAEQHRVFSETRKAWRDEVLADPQIGGAGHQTAMKAIARMRDALVPKADLPAFNDFLRATGAGDHPQFLRLLHSVSRFMDEPTAPAITGNPPKNNGTRPGRRGLQGIYADTASTRATS